MVKGKSAKNHIVKSQNYSETQVKKKKMNANMWMSKEYKLLSLLTNFCKKKKVMSSKGEQQEIYLKLFIKAINEQFRKMNARLDNLQSLYNSKSIKKWVIKNEEDKGSNIEETSL